MSKRYLNQQRRNELKQWLVWSRKKWSRVYVGIYGRFSARQLIDEIRVRIKGDFEILMVHSAYDRLLPMYSGKAQELILELLELCGKDRTLAMPAFVLGGRSYDPCGYYRKNMFDARRTPSEMGLLTEIFRRMPGVKRSLHPTHSICAFGPLAEVLTAGHQLANTRTGQGTPFETMAQRKTVIVGLGIEYYRSLTQIHTAEDVLGKDYPVGSDTENVTVVVIDQNGGKLVYPLEVHKRPTALNCSIARSLLSNEELQEWSFKGVPLYLTFADKVTQRLLAGAKRGITVYGSVTR